MQQRSVDPLRKLSPALFVATALLFFLPFASCSGTEISGVQAATGVTPPGSDPVAVERLRDESIAPNPFALASLLCAVAGVGLIRLGAVRGPFASALAAVAGSWALIGFTIHGFAETTGELEIEIGLSLTFLAFLLTAAMNDLLLARLPLLDMGNAGALARQGTLAIAWSAAIGLALMASMLISSSGETDQAYIFGGLIPVAILSIAALVIGLRRRS